jgi:pimeloyl-ACP methyl ester carboxylesterase
MNIKKVNSTENYLTLPDGRKLCYAEYGDPNGFPVFLFHGNPNSRLLWEAIPGNPFVPNVRLIAPDRYGFGRTDYIEGVTTVESWPKDIVSLADALGIEKFAIFGPSGGGPYALSCAWKIPDRLTAVGIFASVGPLNDETKEGISPLVVSLWENAPKLPGILKLQMKLSAWLVRKKPETYIKIIKKEFGEKDKELYDRLNIGERNMPDRLEAYQQKGIGSWYDSTLPVNWPIPLNDIKTKVLLWQGEEDESASPAMGRYIAKHIPDCEAEYIEGEGHLWVFEHLPEMLEKLVEYKG